MEPSIIKVACLENAAHIKFFIVFYPKPEKSKIASFEKSIFTPDEYESIAQHNTPIYYSSLKIYPDDTILTVKIKVLNELRKIHDNITVYELYLFCRSYEQLSASTVYQSLTHNHRVPITRSRLDYYLSNIYSNTFRPLQKEFYTYSDLFEMKLTDKKYVVDKLVGQRRMMVPDEYPYPVNPFYNVLLDTLYETRYSRDSLQGGNEQLLMFSEPIINNTLYLCLFEDLLAMNHMVDLEDIVKKIKLYYPRLFEQNIFSLDDLTKQRGELLKRSNRYTQDSVIRGFQTVGLFYEAFAQRTTDIQYLSRGITYAHFSVHPESKIGMPLEILFKQLHTSSTYPIIRYNPSFKQENLFRMYSPGKSEDGRQIPKLPKETITQIIKLMKGMRVINIYIKPIEPIKSLLVDIHSSGEITVKIELYSTMTLEELSDIISSRVSPLIRTIKQTLEEGGFVFSDFPGFQSERVVIHQMIYSLSTQITKAFNYSDYENCFSRVFTKESQSPDNLQLNLRFKRTANYNETPSQDMFIVEQIQNDIPPHVIIQNLKTQYPDIIDDEARIKVAEIVNQVNVREGVRRTRKLKTSGFRTSIQIKPNTSTLEIFVEHIDHPGYLNTLPIYLDTIIRFTQIPHETKVTPAEISQMCTSLSIEDIDDDEISDDENGFVFIDSPRETSDVEKDDPPKQQEESDSEPQTEDDSDEAAPAKGMSLFFDMDSDEFSSGGAPRKAVVRRRQNVPAPQSQPLENEVRNIDGMKINKPYYFQEKIIDHDPVLIVRKDTQEFNAYSRICSSDQKRQPVIVSDEELEDIKREYPGFIKPHDVIKYGSEPSKTTNYLCPQYWCLKTDKVIHPSEIKEINGEKVHVPKNGTSSCGKVLDPKSKTITPGHYVYEFHKDSVNKYPGLIPDKHPDGLCLPCCFKNYNSIGRMRANDKCLTDSSNNEDVGDTSYIVDAKKYPLQKDRWGYIPPPLQAVIQENVQQCVKKVDNEKDGVVCLMRHGIVNDKNQSFIHCIYDVLYYGKEKSPKTLKSHILSFMTVDLFRQYHNGNLVDVFQDLSIDVNLQAYSSTNVVRHAKTIQEKKYAKKVISAFQKFREFLSDDTVLIDHTYLWDIVTTPNKQLFSNGINLIIFQISNSDITNNVELLCPSNPYLLHKYNPSRPSVILVKQDNYYEPIYAHTKIDNTKKITKLFKESDPMIPKSAKYILSKLVTPFFNTVCRPLSTIPETYNVREAIPLAELKERFDKYSYKIHLQVMNFNNKIIGVVAEEEIANRIGYVPCFPSGMLPDIPVATMTTESLWKPFSETVQFLRTLSKTSGNKIPCNPVFLVVEDEMVVGILTESNQFVQLSAPILPQDIPINMQLPRLVNHNYTVHPKLGAPVVQTDADIMTSSKTDVSREKYVKKIRFETKFYESFKTTVRSLLNNFSNIKLREKIESIMYDRWVLYHTKLKKIESLIRELVQNHVKFIGKDDYYLTIDEVSSCISNSLEQCKEANMCVMSDAGHCVLILPKRNLVTNHTNEPIYMARLADELIRYRPVQKYMFQPQIYVTYRQPKYDIHDDEIVLSEHVIADYFTDLVPVLDNPYASFNTRDTVEPRDFPTTTRRVRPQLRGNQTRRIRR